MAIEQLRKHPENQSLTRRFGIRLAKGILDVSGVKDLEPKIEVPSVATPFEIPTVNKELYIRIREAVEATGHNFVAPIRPVSIEDLLAEDNQRASRRFGYFNVSKTMGAAVSPEMEIAINPDKFKIEDSNSPVTNELKKKIKKEEARWKEQLPEEIRPFVGMHMVGPSTLSQLEDAYMDKTEGKLLLPDYFARTSVQLDSYDFADVGRYSPTGHRIVGSWCGHSPDIYWRDAVFAVSVVVLPRQSVA